MVVRVGDWFIVNREEREEHEGRGYGLLAIETIDEIFNESPIVKSL